MNNSLTGRFSPVQKLRMALVAMGLVITLGTAGFIVLERMNPLEALYMTVITLSTVGFREVRPLDPTGQLCIRGCSGRLYRVSDRSACG